MKFFHLLRRNLARRKARTLLTLLSIAVAFVLFGYLAAIRQGLSQGVDVAGADRLIVRHKVSLILTLPQSYLARIERIPGVALAAHATWFGGIYQDPKNFFAQMPVVPETFLKMFPEFVVSDEHRRAWLETRTGAVVGRKLADRFGWKLGDRIPIQATIWDRKDGGRTWEFDIVGIYDVNDPGVDNTQFFFRHDYFDETRARGEGEIGWYYVRVTDPDRSAGVAEAIDQEFANSPFETKSESELAFVQGFANQIGNIGVILTAILGTVFFVILLVAGNTMAQAVQERIAELAVIKAIGFTDGKVLGLILGESLLLSGIGGLAGLVLAAFLIAAGDPTRGALPVFFFPRRDMAIGLALVLALGAVAGIFPALQASRLRVAEALRR